MNVVQLAALTDLLLGKHDEAGRALARYAAAISVLLERGFPDALQEHLSVARDLSWYFLSLGAADEFGDLREVAARVGREEASMTSPAVNAFAGPRRRLTWTASTLRRRRRGRGPAYGESRDSAGTLGGRSRPTHDATSPRSRRKLGRQNGAGPRIRSRPCADDLRLVVAGSLPALLAVTTEKWFGGAAGISSSSVTSREALGITPTLVATYFRGQNASACALPPGGIVTADPIPRPGPRRSLPQTAYTCVAAARFRRC